MDVALIEGLEATKAASVEIGIAVAKGKETEIAINILREKYRPVAAEASMLYFMLTELVQMIQQLMVQVILSVVSAMLDCT